MVCVTVTTLVFTIGHSNLQWNEFVNLLKHNQIVTVVDVRRYPSSKSFPQYNKGIISKELLTRNIYYEHIEKLGGRRNEVATSLEYDNRGWQNKSFRYYANYMLTKSFKEIIEKLLSLITKGDDSLAIMCSEAVPWRCNRRLISDYLMMVEGIVVYDIIANSSNRHSSPHIITPFARHIMDENIVIYLNL